MSVEILSSQVDSIRAEAARTSASYTSQARSIDADTSLSAEGKAAAKVEVNANAKEKLRALRQKENDAINMKVRDLEKQLDSKMGSTASDIIAFRDAQDRAERFEKPEDAVRALERAIRTDDTALAHAIFRRGIESGWRDVIATFGNEYPDKKPIVGDLAYLREAQTNTLGRGMNYMWIAQ